MKRPQLPGLPEQLGGSNFVSTPAFAKTKKAFFIRHDPQQRHSRVRSLLLVTNQMLTHI